MVCHRQLQSICFITTSNDHYLCVCFSCCNFAAFGVDDIVGSFYTVVQEPFMGLANSYPSALLLAFITPFLWFFGLHGRIWSILDATINAPAIEANVNAIAAGHRHRLS